ncbi:alpha/beta hydrolase [Roseibium hamelinense]|nr:alpha/beta hydrolase [Roseibium hamelinense]MTI44994.1 alpha/beta hydrolase [Roseibium hamelinense]
MAVLLTVAIILLGFAAYTAFNVRRISRKYTPRGTVSPHSGLHFFYTKRRKSADQRPVLVFLHGASGNALDLKLAFGKGFEQDYDLLFVDRPGLGHSRRALFADASPRRQAERISALLDELSINKAIVVGHSLGASTAAALGLLRPDVVTGLVFLAPATHPWPGGVNWYYSVAALPILGAVFCWTLTLPIGQLLVPKAISNVFKPDRAPDRYFDEIDLPLLFRPASFRANSVDIAYLKPQLAHQSQYYRLLEQPALIVTGDEDSVVWPSIHSEGLQRDLPNANLLVLKGAGHMPHHTHQTEITAAIKDFEISTSGRSFAHAD